MAKKKRQARRKQTFRPTFGWVRPVLALLTVAGSAAGLTLMAEWMQNPRQWPVKRVHIEGKFRHLDSAQLETVVAPLAASGFFVVDVSEIQSRLQALAWVEQVSVRRIWPDKLDIAVREQKPVAHWGDGGYVNARAEVFSPARAAQVGNLPHLQGPEGQQGRVLEMRARMQKLLEPLQLQVGELQLTARRAWRVQLSNGLTLEVGRRHPLQRVARFVRVYPAILAGGTEGRLSDVDLRYSNGFAAHWRAVDATTQHTGQTG